VVGNGMVVKAGPVNLWRPAAWRERGRSQSVHSSVEAPVTGVEPIFERDFAERSFGFRPRRGCKDTLRRVAELLESECTHVVDADLRKFFDTIPHERIMEGVKAKVADDKVLNLIEGYLHQDVMETTGPWTPEQGTPQGAVLSPLLANISLDPLDRLMAERGYEMVRYPDGQNVDQLVLACSVDARIGYFTQKILAKMAEIREMERGKVCPMKDRDHCNHQTWQDGRNKVRYVHQDDLPELQRAIDGYARFMNLARLYADEIIRRSRRERKKNFKKRKRDTISSNRPKKTKI